MHKTESKKDTSTQSRIDPAELRINIVGQQRKIEEEFVNDPKGRAFFLVKNLLTPLYIDPNAVEYDPESNLFIIKPGFEQAIPKHLISKEVLEDPRQLSTVLGRVLSLNKLQKNSVLVFYIKERINVDTKAYERFKMNHANFKFIEISEEIYQSFKEILIQEKKEEVAEATYVYHQAESNNKLFEQCIFATQANNPAARSRWEILKGTDTTPAIKALNQLLEKHKLDLIPIPIAVADEEFSLASSASELAKFRLFSPQSNNTKNSLFQTETGQFPQP